MAPETLEAPENSGGPGATMAPEAPENSGGPGATLAPEDLEAPDPPWPRRTLEAPETLEALVQRCQTQILSGPKSKTGNKVRGQH